MHIEFVDYVLLHNVYVFPHNSIDVILLTSYLLLRDDRFMTRFRSCLPRVGPLWGGSDGLKLHEKKCPMREGSVRNPSVEP